MTTQTKICPKCKKEKLLSEYHNRGDNKGKAYVCKKCHHTYTAEWAAKNRDKTRASSLKWARNLRAEVLKEYGGKCICCDETIVEFLTIDHIDNNGSEHRKTIPAANLYKWLKDNGFPKDNFQILCMNCNFAKGHTVDNQCPHIMIRKANMI